MTTVADLLATATRTLAAHSDSPRLDAELLLGEVLGCSRTSLRVRAEDRLSPQTDATYASLIERRANGMPVAYLVGRREFWSLPLLVTPAVLVPRPDTETLVEAALSLLPADRAARILDLGTGSGAIALALASERPDDRLMAVDLSAAALEIARTNGRRLKLEHIEWREGSWFEPVAGFRFDLIVANPPYIAAGDPALKALVAEPRLALSPGPTGLEALTVIIENAPAYLTPRGWLVLEHGDTQASEVATRLQDHGFLGVHTRLDGAGRPRVTLGYVNSHH